STFWIDITDPTVDDVLTLSKVFKIHPLTAEDVLAEPDETRDKCDIYQHYAFLVYSTFHQLRSPPPLTKNQDNPFTLPLPIVMPFFIILLRHGVISLHAEPTSQVRKVLQRMGRLQGLVQPSPEWITYALLDAITDRLEPLLNKATEVVAVIEEAISSLESSGMEEPEHKGDVRAKPTDLLRKIASGRRLLTQISRLLSGKPDVVRALVKRASGLGDVRLYLGDVLDHTITMSYQVVAAESTLQRAHIAHVAQVNVALASTSARIGQVATHLTFLAQLFLPFLLIGGLFGMNVKVPGR
ncbi:hypothetical protein BJ684DRAFT_3172, partial [Piptocephalis cylindrospora]